MSYRSKKTRRINEQGVDSDVSSPSIDSQPRSQLQDRTPPQKERNPSTPTLKQLRLPASGTLVMPGAAIPRASNLGAPKTIAPGSLKVLSQSKSVAPKVRALTQQKSGELTQKSSLFQSSVSKPLPEKHKSHVSQLNNNYGHPHLADRTIRNKPSSGEPPLLSTFRPPSSVALHNVAPPTSQNEDVDHRASQPINDSPPMEGNVMEGMTESEDSDDNEPEQGGEKASVAKPKSFRSRCVKSKSVVLDWPDDISFDEKEEALTIDVEGNHKLLSGPIQPGDIDNLDVGVRCIVHFNEFNQPIRKGGFVLVKYLAYLAKTERFCPIGVRSWPRVNKHYKVDIIKVVRAKFVIPDQLLFNKAILKRVGRHWRQYKYKLKGMKFDPTKRTKEETIKDVPLGHSLISWTQLVEFWYSEESKKLSECGKEARASQSHVHTTGSTSYANKRADFVEARGKQSSHLEFFKLTHTRIGGGFVQNTLSSQLLEEANVEVEELVRNSSPTKSRTEIENQVFDKLMYENENPKRPVGFGFGVNQSDVFGVHGILSKRGGGSTSVANGTAEMETMKAKMVNMQKENEELRAKVDQSSKMVEQNNMILLQALDAIRTGNVSDSLFVAAQSALRRANSQVTSTSSGNSTRNGSDHVSL